MSKALEEIARIYEARPENGGYRAVCPCCQSANASLRIRSGDDGTILMKCQHAGTCDTKDILKAKGLTFADLAGPNCKPAEKAKPRIVKTYDYCDPSGKPVYQAVRYEPKGFSQRQHNPAGGWIWKMDGATYYPYNVSDIIAAAPEVVVYVAEGEKDADNLKRRGLLATTGIAGAGKWRDEYGDYLAGHHLVILADNDDAGRKHALDVGRKCYGKSSSIKIVLLPGLPPKGDVSDAFEAGLTTEQFLAIVEAAPYWTPDSESPFPEPAVCKTHLEPEKNGGSANADKVSGEEIDPSTIEFKPFPMGALTPWSRRFVTVVSRAIGCDPSYVALPLLVMFAACIGSTRRLLLKRGWYVLCILWGVIVGESGTMKTAPLRLIMRALRERQGRALKRQAEAQREYEADVIRFDQELAEWKKQKNNPNPPPEKPRPPVAERCLVSDVTVEALAPILLDNPRGLALVKDELAGWFGSFDRYASGKGSADAAHWLSMYGGEPVTVDRRKGIPPTIYVPSACVWVCGGIQPGILAKALSEEHRKSGLAARLLLANPPRRRKQWTEAEIPERFEQELAHLVERLYGLQPEQDDEGNVRPGLVSLSPEAKELFVQYYNDHADEQVDLAGDLSAAWSKLEEAAARLALVIHFMRWAEGDKTLANESVLDAVSMRAGIDLALWFKGEAKRAYAQFAESDEQRELRELVEWIERKGRQVSARYLQTFHRKYKAPGAAEAALEKLVKAGFGIWVNILPDASGGRPSREFSLSASAQPQFDCETDVVLQTAEPEFTTQEAFDQAHAWEPPPAPLRPVSQCDEGQHEWHMGKAGRMCCRWCSRTMPEQEGA